MFAPATVRFFCGLQLLIFPLANLSDGIRTDEYPKRIPSANHCNHSLGPHDVDQYTLLIECMDVDPSTIGGIIDGIVETQVYTQDTEKKYKLYVNLRGINFLNDEIRSNWFTGVHGIEGLTIETDAHLSIHANAFHGRVFSELETLTLNIGEKSLRFHIDAFRGLESLHRITLRTATISNPPNGIFDALAMSLWTLSTASWPSNVSLDEMFANQLFRMLRFLQIVNVDLPQTKFRRLAASNFTFTRRLERLWLMNCGIEVIDEDAFNGIGHSLEYLNLALNWIQTIDLHLLRRIFESKSMVKLTFDDNELICSCQLIEVDILICPIRNAPLSKCMACTTPDHFISSACGVQRVIDVGEFCIDLKQRSFMHFIAMGMAYDGHGAFLIKTNFKSLFRMVFVDAKATIAADKCSARAHKSNYKCFSLLESIDRLDVNEMAEIRDAELVLITAIMILYDFGVRPMHTMSIRREKKSNHWLSAEWHVILGILGFTAGVGSAISFMLIRQLLTDSSSEPGHPEYYEQIEIAAAERPIGLEDFEYGYYDHDLQLEAVQNDYI